MSNKKQKESTHPGSSRILELCRLHVSCTHALQNHPRSITLNSQIVCQKSYRSIMKYTEYPRRVMFILTGSRSEIDHPGWLILWKTNLHRDPVRVALRSGTLLNQIKEMNIMLVVSVKTWLERATAYHQAPEICSVFCFKPHYELAFQNLCFKETFVISQRISDFRARPNLISHNSLCFPHFLCPPTGCFQGSNANLADLWANN